MPRNYLYPVDHEEFIVSADDLAEGDTSALLMAVCEHLELDVFRTTVTTHGDTRMSVRAKESHHG